MLRLAESLGRTVTRNVDEIGFAGALLVESLFWTLFGRRRRQPVRINAMFEQMAEIGVLALPITTVLSATIGVMLAIQSLYTLSLFGAQSFAAVGIALAVVREFAPLIVAVLVAGRSGASLAARLSTMTINQEIDALLVIGINPVRYLVAPPLLAMLVMVPALTMWADLVALGAAGLFVSASLDISLAAFVSDSLAALSLNDLSHGLGKSAIFAVLIALVGAVNGALVTGGAEGVGRVTTRAVVHAIAGIVITDMTFALLVTG